MSRWGRYIILFLGITVVCLLSGQNNSQRQFDQQDIAEYQSDPSFDYSTEYAPSDSFLSRVLAYIMNGILRLIGNSGIAWLTPYLFRVILIILAITAIVIIVRMRYGPAIVKGPKTAQTIGISKGGSEEIDYDKWIHQYTESQQYRLVIRYLFLKVLHSLGRQNLIKLEDWKAPIDYGMELKDKKRKSFHELATCFESTWYGDYPADQQLLNRCKQLSNELSDV